MLDRKRSSIEIPILGGVQLEWLKREIQAFLTRFNLGGDVVYDQGAKPPWFFPVPQGCDALGTLRVTIADMGGQDEVWVMRNLISIVNELAIPIQTAQIVGEYDRTHSALPSALSIDEAVFEGGLWNSIRALKRASGAMLKVDQFIHLWRSFNALYSCIYQKENREDPRRARTKQETMFRYVIQRYLTPKDCRELVDHFLEGYDLLWLAELKTVAQRTWKEMLERRYVVENGKWKSILNIRKGLDFWDQYRRNDYLEALKELVAFVYDANRNAIFHGLEPSTTSEDMTLMNVSIALLHDLDTRIISGILRVS